jgi:hypothetical protein
LESLVTRGALDPADLTGTPLETLVGGLLLERDGHWIGLVTLTGVQDPEGLAELARRTGDVTLPVLRAIGITVAAGVVSNFVLALLLTRRPESSDDARW